MGVVEAGLRQFARDFSEFLPPERVFVDFMENTLSEHGSYYVTWDRETDDASLEIIVYGRVSEVFRGTLREVLDYVQAHHWYGDPQPDYDDEDY